MWSPTKNLAKWGIARRRRAIFEVLEVPNDISSAFLTRFSTYSTHLETLNPQNFRLRRQKICLFLNCIQMPYIFFVSGDPPPTPPPSPPIDFMDRFEKKIVPYDLAIPVESRPHSPDRRSPRNSPTATLQSRNADKPRYRLVFF